MSETVPPLSILPIVSVATNEVSNLSIIVIAVVFEFIFIDDNVILSQPSLDTFL